MRITLVVAAAENDVIGRDGALPWHLPADLARFKRATLGHPVLMGRRTHESIGRPLPDRTNIVLTRRPGYEAPGCTVVHGLDDAIRAGEATGSDELMVIGGAAIYASMLPVADRILLTRVHAELEGDTRFPELGPGWEEHARERREPDDRNPYPLTFITLTRRGRTSATP